MFQILPTGNIQLQEPLRQPVWLAHGITIDFTVPAGFVSDGASIPSCLWLILGPPIRSNHLIPSVVHDYLCESATDYNERLLGDAVFFKLLKDHDVPAWKRSLMYLGVRLYGRWRWRRQNAGS